MAASPSVAMVVGAMTAVSPATSDSLSEPLLTGCVRESMCYTTNQGLALSEVLGPCGCLANFKEPLCCH